MRSTDLITILPLGVLAGAAVVTMLLIACRRHHGATAVICVVGLALAFAAIPIAAERVPAVVTPLLAEDGYAIFYQGLVVLCALAVALLSYGYLEHRKGVPREEYYVLLLLATLGAATVVASNHFASFFLGLETLSLSLVGLVGYPAAIERPIEASLKYLILSGVSSAFLLFGIALVYAALGTLSFGPTTLFDVRPGGLSDLYRLAGVAMILVGIGFKLSVVPFHMWAPDVYQGAPAPVTAFVAVVSKTAVFALLLRYFLATGAFRTDPLLIILSVIAVLSMLAGNLLALLQDNVKRILAYSSIAHLGYALVAFLSGGALAVEAVSLYLVAYAVTSLGAFGVVALLSRSDGPGIERDADDIADYRGLFRTHPWLALTFTAMLLSLAGIPLTVGFIAKFYAVTSGVSGKLAAPIAALVIGSIVGLYYYLRIVIAMVQPSPDTASAPAPATPWLGNAVMAILLVLLIGLGVYPTPLVGLIRVTAVTLTGNPGARELAELRVR